MQNPMPGIYEQRVKDFLSRCEAEGQPNLYWFTLQHPILAYQFSTILEKNSQSKLSRRLVELEPMFGEGSLLCNQSEKIIKYISSFSLLLLLFNRSIEIEDSVFHLMILYILTDDLLDSPSIEWKMKDFFAKKIETMIQNESIGAYGDTSTASPLPPELLMRIALIQKHIQLFFQKLLTHHPLRKIKDCLSQLNTIQAKCAINYSMESISVSTQIPSYEDLCRDAEFKGAITLKLIGLLLFPEGLEEKMSVFLCKLGALYQHVDDIQDWVEDLKSSTMTPAIMALIGHVNSNNTISAPETHNGLKIILEFRAGMQYIWRILGDPATRAQMLEPFYCHCLYVLQEIASIGQSEGLEPILLNKFKLFMIDCVKSGIGSIRRRCITFGSRRLASEDS